MSDKPHQSASSVEKNSSFFRDNLSEYNSNVQQLDTYAAIRASLNEALRGCGKLMDIGNGGVFDYDTSLAREIVALDLFLDDLPAQYSRPANVTFRTGSALSIPEADGEFDAVLMVMLLHHLVGRSVAESWTNTQTALKEAMRVLRPGGKLILVESCVPRWFYTFERAVFPIANSVIHWFSEHPATLQYPAEQLASALSAMTPAEPEMCRIEKGRWVLQFGVKFPAALTPVYPYRFVLQKPSE
ncbi:MAG TPA: methyltransferase domain-containing protein [Bryobacteraceae bacterium]|nr:methyltransferase domain-containing protein [Bryobacteraceae bacterium]